MENRFTRRATKKKAYRSDLPFRLNLIIVIVFLLFAALVGQLFYLQIKKGAYFVADVNRTDNLVETSNVQRGMIYDSTGQVLVGNSSTQAISYTKGVNVLSSQMFVTANELGSYLKVDTKTLAKRSVADYWLASEVQRKAVDKVIPNFANLTPDAQYQAELSQIMDNPQQYKLNRKQKNAAMIFQKMAGAYSLSTTYIKESGVTSKEVAQIGEHLSQMPGVKISTAWSRDYPQGKSVQAIIGSVTSEKIGLPEDRLNSLLASGYSRNDSVGQSYLEQQYEPVLKGSKEQTQVVMGANNKIVKAVEQYSGRKGDNLVLTINSKFQAAMEKALRDHMSGSLTTGAYAVAMNPYTGGIYGIAGVDRNNKTGKLSSNALGAMNQAIVMGSAVKPAMVTGALKRGVITPTNSTLNDQPIKIAGTPVMSTDWNKSGSVPLNASTAIEVSSNSYMMQLAMLEGGVHYAPNIGLGKMNPDIFNIMRNNFNLFGLGVKTGIDLPGETAGIKGSSGPGDAGKALMEAYGQYDAYTVLQLAQYVSTIANGGYRVQPHVVGAVESSNNDGQLDQIQTTIPTKILNSVGWTPAQRQVIYKGMHDVVNGTNAHRTGMQMQKYKPAPYAKTGTAETFTNGKSTLTLSLVTYIPGSNIAIALAMPSGPQSNFGSGLNLKMAMDMYNAYFKYIDNKSTIIKNPANGITKTGYSGN
ncbi:penicillin-binding protein 2 [Periweissella cryptocerci]|uniref:Penicillin-binding protein 2 n=1 Tax=Periweissella cryptocerci TaxID=2506420 RepID=A0A4P6YRW6_9LACO|nr:penicillin-binding protein 2 [Periweissella cryptocerci]QBO35352.1 penicillin-binding protein 2 [Periweissella cryptocerci]